MNKPARGFFTLAVLIGCGVVSARLWRAPKAATAVQMAAATNPIPPLERRTGPLNFEGVSFAEALDQLSVRTHTTIVVDRAAIEWCGASTLAPVRLHWPDTSLKEALSLVAAATPDYVGPRQFWNGRLGAWARAGVVYVGALDPLDPYVEVRAYSIGDVLSALPARWPRDPVPPEVDILSAGRASLPPIPGVRYMNRAEHLFDIVMDNVDPLTWRDTGGASGKLMLFGGTLLVVQTPANLEKVEKLIAHLRSPEFWR